MKVLMINGSPRVNGNTSVALSELEKVFHKNGVETETIQVGMKEIRGCVACNYCFKNGKCAIDDIVNELAEKLIAKREADARAVLEKDAAIAAEYNK